MPMCRCSLSACARNAGTVKADSTNGSDSGAAAGLAARAGAAGLGGSSTMTWALVPPMPNELTPARRGRSPAGHGCSCCTSAICAAAQSTAGVGSTTCSVMGSLSWCMASTVFMTPARPAAACVWPRLDLTEPTHNGRSGVWLPPNTAARPLPSIGSPSLVPVPWASR